MSSAAQPPDWLLQTPTNAGIHTVPVSMAQQFSGPDLAMLARMCAAALLGQPFSAGVASLGSSSSTPQGATASHMINGLQFLVDFLCALLTGISGTTGTTPQSMMAGATQVNNTVHTNMLTSGVLQAGQTGGSTGNLAVDFINGATSLTSLFNATATNNPAATLPADITSLINTHGGLLALPQQIIDTVTNTLLGTSGIGGLVSGIVRAVQSIPAEFLTGTAPPNMFNNAPIGAVSSVTPQLLTNPNFDSPNSMLGQGVWTWDGTQGPPGVPTSVYTNADGTQIPLFSNLIHVNPGQVLNISGFAKWTGFSGATNSIALTIAQYSGGTLLAAEPYHLHAGVTSPGAASSGWVQLGSPYTVPAGVDSIFVRPLVDSTATAGKVSFGAMSAQPAATSLLAALVPGIDASKIISGVLGALQVPNVTLSMSSDLQGLNNYITNTLVGVVGQYTGTTLPQSNGSMASLYSNVVDNTQAIQALQSNSAVTQQVVGVSVHIDFANYPNGPMPSIFTQTYSGAGTSTLGISAGTAGWTLVNDANRQCVSVYNAAPTNTDYQQVRGSMSSAPAAPTAGGAPRIWSIGRVDSPLNPQNYVWARAYCTAFLAYACDLGCTVAGVDTVFVSGVALTWSTAVQIVIGVNGNPRRYQVFSGTQLVIDYTEAGTTSQFGSGFRYWGAKTEMTYGTGGAPAGDPGRIAGTSVNDNATPVSVGSVFRYRRLSTGTVAMATGFNYLPASFFDTIGRETADYLWDQTNSILTINNEGTYAVELSYTISSLSSGTKLNGAIWLSTGGGAFTLEREVGGAMCDVGANSPSIVAGACLIYCKAGDQLRFGYYYSCSTGTLTGDANGSRCGVGVALANRSMA